MLKRIILTLIVCVIIVATIGYIERGRLYPLYRTLRQNLGRDPLAVQTEDVEFLSGKLHLRGTLYAPASSFWKYPGIVICHGGTQLGRRLALYVVMARKLAERGYVVLTFDFRGFGESEDPQRFKTFSDLDFTRDVSSALTYLSKVTRVNPSKLYVIGHSFGGGVGVAAATRDVRIQKAVSISPGRCTQERFFGENAPEPDWSRTRMSNDMKIHPPIPREIFNPHLIDYVAEAILDFPVHPPILLIDGERESQKELAFLKEVYENMTEPKGYATIRAADHYFGTKRDQDGSSGDVRYDEETMTELIEVIDSWFQAKIAYL